MHTQTDTQQRERRTEEHLVEGNTQVNVYDTGCLEVNQHVLQVAIPKTHNVAHNRRGGHRTAER